MIACAIGAVQSQNSLKARRRESRRIGVPRRQIGGAAISEPGRTAVKRRHPRVPQAMSVLTPISDLDWCTSDVRYVPCVDGSELARRIFTSQGLVGAAMCSAC